MKALLLIARVIVSIIAFGVAAFCAFGFLAATIESPNWAVALVYGIIGIGSLLIVRFPVSVIALGVAPFCAFGFLAAINTESTSWTVALVHGIICIGSLGVAIVLLTGGERGANGQA